MKETRAIRILARRGLLGSSGWAELLETRANLLREFLREMTLLSVGDVKMYGRQRTVRTLGEFLPMTVTSEVKPGLATRGIFQSSHESDFMTPLQVELDPKESIQDRYVFWGLTRNVEWLVVRVRIVFRPDGHCVTWNGLRNSDTLVDIKSVQAENLQSETGSSFYDIWAAIGDYVKIWVDGRARQLREAERLRTIIELEETQLADRGDPR